MTRVKRGVIAKKKHKKILKLAKGYYGARSRVFRVAKQAVIKAAQYAYRDRKCKKRTERKKWIITINAALKDRNIKYNNFIKNIKDKNIKIDRKMLYILIKENIQLFDNIIKNTYSQNG